MQTNTKAIILHEQGVRKVYLAGPMRDIEDFNFPAFHCATQELRFMGFEVFSAAEYEEAMFGVGFNKSKTGNLKDIKMPGWDFRAAFAKDCDYISKTADAVVVLPGWGNSKGATAEAAIARALGLPVLIYPTLEHFMPQVQTIVDERNEVRVTDSKTGGQKGVKLARFDLIPHEPLWELAEVYGRGAKKYSDDNWRKGYSWRLSIGALFRHLCLWISGQKRDEEGNHHLAQVAWHCFTLYWYERFSKGTDDRSTSNFHDTKV